MTELTELEEQIIFQIKHGSTTVMSLHLTLGYRVEAIQEALYSLARKKMVKRDSLFWTII